MKHLEDVLRIYITNKGIWGRKESHPIPTTMIRKATRRSKTN